MYWFAGLGASTGAAAPVDSNIPSTKPNASSQNASSQNASPQSVPPLNDSQPVSDSQSKPQLASDPQAAAEPSAEPTGFVQTTLAELGKVVWPTRSQLFSESVAVILMVGLSAAAIAAVDRFYGWTALQVFR